MPLITATTWQNNPPKLPLGGNLARKAPRGEAYEIGKNKAFSRGGRLWNRQIADFKRKGNSP